MKMTLYELVESLLGKAPDELVTHLYYVLCICLVIFMLKVILNVMRSIFNVSKY